MKWTNDITRLLGIDFPIVQAPMFGVTTPAMVAAAGTAGCLGSLALADLDAEQCRDAIHKTRMLTQRPFAVNLFVHHIPGIDDRLRADYAEAKVWMEQLAQRYNLAVELPAIDDLAMHNYAEQIEAIMDENCKIVSFTFGNLDPQSIARLKSRGTVLIGTCTSVKEAELLAQADIDIICVQGIEAGGHRGTFATEDIPAIGGLSLLAQVSEAVKVPLLYAGGIYNAKTLLAARALGANGFQIGSLLLGSAESALHDFEKDRLRRAKESDIVLTKSFSGRFARGIKNIFVDESEASGLILPYPYQNKLTAELRKVARLNKLSEFVNIWMGQSISEFSSDSTTTIFKRLIEQTEILAD